MKDYSVLILTNFADFNNSQHKLCIIKWHIQSLSIQTIQTLNLIFISDTIGTLHVDGVNCFNVHATLSAVNVRNSLVYVWYHWSVILFIKFRQVCGCTQMHMWKPPAPCNTLNPGWSHTRVCAHTHTHAYTHTCTHTCTYTHTHTHTCAYVTSLDHYHAWYVLLAFMYPFLRACAYICMCMHVCVCVCELCACVCAGTSVSVKDS